jgi:hypothetical protein
MEMSNNPVIMMHDHAMNTHWAQAMGITPSRLMSEPRCDNVLEYCTRNDVWFVPTMDGETIVQDERLEHFRLAMLHGELANITDIGTHLDDDLSDSIAAIQRLTSNDPDENGNQSWIMTAYPYSIVYRTLSRIVPTA